MLDPRAVAPTAWRNGLGSTRELAAGTDPDDSTSWRISVATLDHDVEFSTFPGMDRTLVALGPLRLSIDGQVAALEAGDRVSFAGESDVSVALAMPTSALNVMTRRGSCRSEVVLRTPDGRQLPGTTESVDLEIFVADVRIHLDQEIS
ncbi:MAG: HutD family protein [Aeromicrobium sp.]